jgi:hypothetical protein
LMLMQKSALYYVSHMINSILDAISPQRSQLVYRIIQRFLSKKIQVYILTIMHELLFGKMSKAEDCLAEKWLGLFNSIKTTICMVIFASLFYFSILNLIL